MSTPTTGRTPAGWYLDPRTPGRTRWWDGSQWTAQLQPIAPVEERVQPAEARAWMPGPLDVPVVEPQQPYWSESPQAVLAARVSRGGAGLAAGTYPAPASRRTRGRGLNPWWVLLTCALLALAVVIYAVMAPPNGPASFSGGDATGTTTISWVDDGDGTLTGSIQRVPIDATATPDGLTNVGFTGTLHHGQISISITMLGTTVTMLGTVHGSTLTLNIPNDDGTLSPRTLTRTTPAGWTERLGAWVTETLQLGT